MLVRTLKTSEITYFIITYSKPGEGSNRGPWLALELLEKGLEVSAHSLRARVLGAETVLEDLCGTAHQGLRLRQTVRRLKQQGQLRRSFWTRHSDLFSGSEIHPRFVEVAGRSLLLV